ncbi:MAG: ATP synthase F1 subunit epsilon [bacterium]
MHLSVITPEKIVFQDEVQEITIPTSEGEITILPHHVPLMSVLGSGAARVVKEGREYFLAVTGGFLQVKPGNQVVILADSADRAEELDLQKIEASKKAAEDLLKEKRALSDVEYAALAANLERELARLKVARKSRRGSQVSAPDSE